MTRPARGAAAAALAAGLVAACATRAARPDARRTFPWAARTLAGMTLEEKAAQLFGVRAFGLYQSPESEEWRALLAQVGRGVGVVVAFDSEVESLPRVLNALQSVARVPLLVAADAERGMGFRVRRGTVPLPPALAFGAVGSEDAAHFLGEVTAREARALGVHWALAPVADVNSDPGNPVINVRSFGENPELVARLVAAFVRGARAGGLLTTAKHFPGHGDTSVDTHLDLATLGADPARLEAVELRPFRAAIEAGVDGVMLGHVAVPALDPTGAPASLSRTLGAELLRDRMGFQGLVVTDALEMKSLRTAWTGEAATRALQAGADVLLLPTDLDVAIGWLVRSVREGRLAESRLDASVRRILEAKERLGLNRARLVDAAALGSAVARPEDVARAAEIARRSITVVRNDGVLPIRAEEPVRLLHLALMPPGPTDLVPAVIEEELEARRIPYETLAIAGDLSPGRAEEIRARALEATHVLASSFLRVPDGPLPTAVGELLGELQAGGRPVVLVSFGSPYVASAAPSVGAYVCAYGPGEASQRAALAALLGEYAVGGRLPVALPGVAPAGHGIEVAKHDMTLRVGRPEEVGFKPGGLAEADAVIDRALTQKAFPGGVLAVGKDWALVHLRAFGRLSYDADAPAVTAETIYDLASLTKVIVTTTMAMMLVDEGRLDPYMRASAFLPGFTGGAKDRVTLWHLLTHSSGVDWWAPLYKEFRSKDAYLRRIEEMDLAYEPGTKSLYSDLGLLLLGEVLERVAGETIDAFARRRIFEPLGMTDTFYRPSPAVLPRIAPTEKDPWRGRMIRGEVHDENAYGMGGVAPHAGLFGTASDVAKFAQLMLNGGIYGHRRLVSRKTVELFTARAGLPGSSRALGWDTPSEGSSAGTLLSARSFGHTGFTGTSLWVDPERRLFVVLLTNRVHPTRENNQIREVRPAVADAVVRGLVQP